MKNPSWSPFLLPLLAALSSPARPQGRTLLGDLNRQAGRIHSSNPGGRVYDPTPGVSPFRFPVLGKQCFFQADDGIHGAELWRAGTTPGSVKLLKDIAPGPESSKPDGFRAFRGKMLFSAWTPSAGREPWISDGTPGGTRLLADLAPGKSDGGFYDPVILNHSLFFFARTSASPASFGLYRFDGAGKAPALVKGGFSGPWFSPVSTGKYIAFRCGTPKTGPVPWVTDGSPSGTIPLPGFSFPPSTSSFMSPLVLGNQVWFAAEGSPGWGIWKTDGKKAFLATRINLPMQGWEPAPPLGSRILFAGADPSFNPHVLDTGTGKVTLLKKISTGWARGFSSPILWKGYIYFTAADSSYRPYPTYSLWRTDGTPGGTVKVVPEKVFPPQGGFGPVAGPRCIFFEGRGARGRTLWRTDGTPGGTFPLGTPEKAALPSHLTLLGGTLLFSALGPKAGRELFSSDGTPAGTGLLKDLYPGFDTLSSGACLFTAGLSRCWFLADDSSPSTTRLQLWITGGIPGKARKLSAARLAKPDFLFLHRNLVLFLGSTGGKASLWRSDGTPAGTFPFFSPRIGRPRFDNPVSLGNKVLFQGESPGEGIEPWVTDGTAGGTRLLVDVLPGFRSGGFKEPVKLGRIVLFSAADGAMGKTLWVTDGTPPGTRRLLSDLVHCENLVKLGDRVLFEGMRRNSLTGIEPWITDGTPAGTRELADLYKGAGNGRFLHPFRAGGRVLFLGTDGFTGTSGTYSLYATDGTAAGTGKVGNFLLAGLRKIDGRENRWGIPLQGGKALFWPVPAGKENRGPWVTDGTAKGTFLLKDFGPLYSKGRVVYARAIGAGRAWFLSDNRIYLPIPPGRLWETDGTPGGTRKVPALRAPGIRSLLWPPLLFRGKVLLTMNDVLHGAEPWIVDTGATARKVGRPSGTAELECGDPVLGGILPLAFTGVPAGAVPILLAGLPGKAAVPLSRGAEFYLDPSAGLLFSGILPGGRTTWPLPGNPSLAGLRLGLQGLAFPTGVPPLGADFTNGVFLTLGKK